MSEEPETADPHETDFARGHREGIVTIPAIGFVVLHVLLRIAGDMGGVSEGNPGWGRDGMRHVRTAITGTLGAWQLIYAIPIVLHGRRAGATARDRGRSEGAQMGIVIALAGSLLLALLETMSGRAHL